jgi:uncharacterized coiled-coil protein SlyX
MADDITLSERVAELEAIVRQHQQEIDTVNSACLELKLGSLALQHQIDSIVNELSTRHVAQSCAKAAL